MGLHEPAAVRKAADELILIDNPAEGPGHRVVAQFVNAEIVKLSGLYASGHGKAFGKEFTKWLAQEQRIHDN
ncbi:MAG TPA: hypothetical protein VI756_11695 [Blastocatellia bacterium]